MSPRSRQYLLITVAMTTTITLLALALVWIVDQVRTVGGDYRSWTSASIQETLSRGEQIVTALESHHKTAGRYPANLNGLVPAYLAQIPKATTGVTEWGYSTQDDGASYTLSFYANKDKYPCGWTDRRQPGGWRIDQ